MARLNPLARTTVITGAASGMGAEIARRLARRGAHLALIDRNGDALAAIAAEIRALCPAAPEDSTEAASPLAPQKRRVTTYIVDLVDDDAVAEVCTRIEADHGAVQALITCAGSSMLGTIDQLTMQEMRWLMDVNLWGTVNVTRGLLPALRKSPQAHVTHLASIYGLAAPGGRVPYAMSKFAVRGFSEALRHELEGSSVSVGTVYPAGVKTGIIFAGRFAAALDPAIAQRAAAAQAKMYDTQPSKAADIIVNATLTRRARTMIGRKAFIVDALVRALPVRHWNVMRGPLREATDTTTPLQ